MQRDGGELICTHLDKDDLATCQAHLWAFYRTPCKKGRDGSCSFKGLNSKALWQFSCFHWSALAEHKRLVSRSSLQGGKWSCSHPWGDLGGSRGFALAASAFSINSLISGERARSQKCLWVNSLSLLSASDTHWWRISVFIFFFLLLGRIIS